MVKEFILIKEKNRIAKAGRMLAEIHGNQLFIIEAEQMVKKDPKHPIKSSLLTDTNYNVLLIKEYFKLLK